MVACVRSVAAALAMVSISFAAVAQVVPALGLQLDGEHVHAPLLVARESLKFCTSHRSSHSRSKTNAITKGTSASPMSKG